MMGSTTLVGLTGCQRLAGKQPPMDEWTPPGPASTTGAPDVIERLTPGTGSVPVGTGESHDAWVYDEQYPGPELRMKEGERLRVDVTNQLPAPTTVHWHGIPVPNRMDGVPDLTQDPIKSGEGFRYEFEATPPGTYLYHSHVDF